MRRARRRYARGARADFRDISWTESCWYTRPLVSRDPAFLAECVALANELRQRRTLAGLIGCPEWQDLKPRLEKVLGLIHRHEPSLPPDEAPDPQRLMVVQWNIEHGNRFERVLAALRDHPQLQDADLLLIQEADLGMARSGNRDVAADLARGLYRYSAWAPLFLETTLGRHADQELAGGRENLEGLFGLAILSRWPIGEARLVELPSPVAIHYDTEGMYGRYVALVAVIERPAAPFVAVSVHLDVHRTRADRARQMESLVAALARERHPIVLGGDFNSGTFDRGRWWDPILSGLALAFQPHLHRRLLHPDRGVQRERLFDALREGRFEWHPLNDRRPSLRLQLERLPELDGWMGRIVPRRLLRRMEDRAAMRLDWIAGRDWRRGRGATVVGLDGPDKASDHAPILAEMR
jgi:endonuclease/exonuclease/phosphatase family metal-dependent hydrolase